jgi:hypothetical protein
MDLEKEYTTCPLCGHDWIAHFGMVKIDGEGKDQLVDPYPIPCMDCEPGSGCMYAIDLGVLRKLGVD